MAQQREQSEGRERQNSARTSEFEDRERRSGRDRDRESERGGESRGEMSVWRPFGDLESWLTPWEAGFPRRRFFEDFFRDFGGLGSRGAQGFVPAVELSENDESYAITVELPGVSKDDIQVDLREGMLVVHGEKRSEREEKKERGRYLERSYGSFSRTFTLPSDADSERMEASFKDGVLTIRIPRSEQSRPRQIQIQ
jgi:HSP20 family protein